MPADDRVDRADPHFLRQAPPTPEAEALFEDDRAEVGFVMNASRLWAYQPATNTGLFDLLAATIEAGALTLRQRGVLVAATASTVGDSYCSVAWGTKLAGAADADLAASVLRGDDDGLTDAERAMAHWARSIVRAPSTTRPADVDALRRVGFTDEQIFAITVFVGLRLAFSTVNAALGAGPDAAFATAAPAAVRDAVTWGRPIAG